MSTTESNVVNNSPAGSSAPVSSNGSVNNCGNVSNTSGNSSNCVPNNSTAAEVTNAAISSVGSTSTATTTTTTGEPLKIIKTQLIPFHALQSHSQLIATAPSTGLIPTITNINTSTSIATSIKPLTTIQTNNTQIINLSTSSNLPTIQLKNLSHPFALNPSVAAKITQLKTAEGTTNAGSGNQAANVSCAPPSSTVSTSNIVASSTSTTSGAVSNISVSISSASHISSPGATLNLSSTSGTLTSTTGPTGMTVTATPIALTVPPTNVIATSVPTTLTVVSATSLVSPISIATSTAANSSGTVATSSSLTNIKTTASSVLASTGTIVNAASSAGSAVSTNPSSIPTMVGAIKVSASGNGPISLSSPVSINTTASPITTSASIRAIGAGGQSTQVRVVMPTSSMIKQIENATPGRTQITALPASPVPRSISNAAITVTRPVTQATYLPRATVTATTISGVANGQRLVTPVRATPASIGATGSTVTGISASNNFVKGTTVSRNTASPGTTLISPATNATWMTANSTTGQVQLIRNIPQQSRQRIITAIAPGGTSTGSSVSPAVVTGSPVVSQVGIAASSTNQSLASQPSTQQATIQSVSSPTSISVHSTQPQPTYVATLSTVLPPRQHPAALVYSSNVAATTQAISQSQVFSPTVTTTQRFAVAAQLAGGTGSTGATRQIRPIQLSKSFSTAKLNTTSISIRAPPMPQLTPTLNASVSAANVTAGNSSPRSTTVTGTSTNVIPTSNLSATRIIQLQQPPNGTTPHVIGHTSRLGGNVMLQPIILNPSGGKIGLRPPVTMAAKVQPSLTITQLGISKLSSTGTATVTANALTPQNISTNIQTIGNSGGVSPSISTAGSITATNLSTSSSGPQLLSTQNIITSTSSATSATVVPLAISTRGATSGNILAGTITPIKSANGITLGKVMTSSSATSASVSSNNNIIETSATISPASVSSINSVAAGNANVFIHQRPNSTGGANVALSVPSSNIVSPSSTATSTSGLSTITHPTSTSTAFLPPGSTIYYESIPASTIQVSTGVLSLTTTTVSNTTNLQNQNTSSTTITSMPYTTHPSGQTPATFTVVPSTGGRTIGQLQIPVSSSASQITAVPFRFNNQVPASSMSTSSLTAIDSITVSQPKTGQQIIIPATHNNSNPTNSLQAGTQMVIPLQTSIKVTTGALGGIGSNNLLPNFVRKRETEGPLRAAKNLGPTLLSMSSNSHSGCASPVSSIGYNMLAVSMPLTIETLASKDRAAAENLTSSSHVSKPASPASSDGSTTLSVTSSPGLEQQMQDGGLLSAGNDSMHFNPIKEMYPIHNLLPMQHNLPSTSGSSRNSSLDHRQQLQPSPTSQRLNGGGIITYDCPPRKKSRRSTIDSQVSTQSHSSLNLPPPNSLINPLGVQLEGGGLLGGGTGDLLITATSMPDGTHNPCLLSNSSSSNTMPPATGNKENAKPTEYILRRPRNCSLLNGYKLTWKGTNNHFQRYSDVKPRKPNPSVIDLANQPNILAKINGWKIYHLQSQMKDLCDDENAAYERLADMLKQMETHEQNSDMERISDLLKGNMQRSKIIVDGVNEAQNQIMKIFEHKTHVSDIIIRCASKRNFKKREKV